MSTNPVFLADTVTNRPGRASGRPRIDAAFPRRDGSGLTLFLNALPRRGQRIVLLEPAPPTTSAVFFPSSMPTDLATRRALRGEKRVWEALRRTPLPPGTRVFYNRAPRGCRRRADFLILHPQRGLIAIEVKGGRVRYHDGFRQRVTAPSRDSKRIQPWRQAQRAVGQMIAALEINPLLIPPASVSCWPM